MKSFFPVSLFLFITATASSRKPDRSFITSDKKTKGGAGSWKECHIELAHGPFPNDIETTTSNGENISKNIAVTSSETSTTGEPRKIHLGGWKEHHVELAHGPFGIRGGGQKPTTTKKTSKTISDKYPPHQENDHFNEGLDNELFERFDQKLFHRNTDDATHILSKDEMNTRRSRRMEARKEALHELVKETFE